MNSVYEGIHFEEIGLNQIETNEEEYAVEPLGTFAGTIYKVLYCSDGKSVPSDTSDQLIFDGLK
jgi:hypothetical protein